MAMQTVSKNDHIMYYLNNYMLPEELIPNDIYPILFQLKNWLMNKDQD